MDDLNMSVFVVRNLREDTLKEFSLSRVERWNNILNNLTSKENLDDIVDINDEEIFGASDEEQEHETDTEDYECRSGDSFSENDDSGLNISIIEQNVTVTNAQDILTLIAQNPNTTGIVNEDREFLEKTLPIFEKFNRKIRQDGFEKLLNTFDQRKIEKYVGKMMPRRNHYLSPYNGNCCFPGYNSRSRGCAYARCDSDSESFDENRYVRSTQDGFDFSKRYEMTTTIKSYRSIKSRRNKLREKYGYDVPDNTMQELSNGIYREHRRNAFNACQCWKGSQSFNHHATDARPNVHRNHNYTNHLLFHGDRSISSNTSFEDEVIHPNRCKKHVLYCQCRDCRSYNYGDAMIQQKRHHLNFQTSHSRRKDRLPLVRESECGCRESKRLCNHARHLANSSTDDWFVNKYDSPEPAEYTSKRNDNNKRGKRLHKEHQQCSERSKQRKADEINLSEDATLGNIENEAIIEHESDVSRKISKRNIQVDKVQNFKSSIKEAKRSNKKTEAEYSSISKAGIKKDESTFENSIDDSFERELQLAIKTSKELYAKEQAMKQTKSSTNDTENVQTNGPGKTTKRNVSFLDEREATKGKSKKQFASLLADISSESESNENMQKVDSKNGANKEVSHSNVKVYSNLDSKENKKVRGVMNTNSKSTKSKPKTNKRVSKKEVTKLKYHGTFDFKNSDGHLKPKSTKYDNPESINFDNDKTLNSLELNKLRICDDSATDSTDGNNTVKIKTKNDTIVSENTTFFANPSKICNSTALTSPIVKSRQLLSIKKTSKCKKSPTTTTATSHHYELPSTSRVARNAKSEALKNELDSPTDSSDCKMVSSTTETEKLIQETLKPKQSKSKKTTSNTHIILYTPHDSTLVPESSFVNNKYRLTLEHLGSVIGQKYAEVFFRYYRGKRDFKLTSTVKYIPPRKGYYSGNDTSEDDIDPFDAPDIGQIEEQKN